MYVDLSVLSFKKYKNIISNISTILAHTDSNLSSMKENGLSLSMASLYSGNLILFQEYLFYFIF